MSEAKAVSTHAPLSEHPDIVAMNARYEWASESPTAQVANGLTIMAGLFMALSPWIVGFNGARTLMINNLVIGLTVALLGMSFAAMYERSHRVTWVCPMLGAWAIISPWVVTGAPTTTGVVLSNVIGGAVIVLLGLADEMPMFLTRREVHR